MKYIESLELNNFESWSNEKIIFDKGLNIIIGNSDSGKSGSFRALDSVINGKFKDNYITFGKKKASVQINFSDKHFAKRIRGNRDNIIQYDDLVFERAGKEIPNEYFENLGKTKLQLSDGKEIDLCLYSQFINHFFITSTDIEKNKIIGAACGIDIVDKIVDNINSDIRHNNSEIKFLKNIVDEQQTKVNQLKLEIENEKDLLSKLEKYLGRANTSYNKLVEICHLSQNYKFLNSQIQNSNSKIKFLNSKSKLNSQIQIQISKLNLLFQIQNSNSKIKFLNSQIQIINSKLNSISKFKLKFQILNLSTQTQNLNFKIQNSNSKILNSKSKFQLLNSKLKIQIQKFQLLNSKMSLLKDLLLSMNNIKQQINQKTKLLKDKLNEKDNLHKETGICPLCGNKIGENK